MRKVNETKQMKRKLLTLLALMMISMVAWTQERQIIGTLVDKETNEPMTHATVQLLKTDSTFVTGAVSNKHGAYTLKAPANGCKWGVNKK